MVIPKRKGSSHERSLANRFWESGFAVLRGCSSGGGVRRRFVPDIVALMGGRVIVIEAKYRSRAGYVHVEGEKVRRLLEFARRAGGEAYVAVKFGRDEWRLIPVTSDNELILKPQDLHDALSLEQFMNRFKSRSLLDYINEQGSSEDPEGAKEECG